MILVEIKSDSRYPVDKEKIRQRIRDLLKLVGIEGKIEVSVAIVGNRKMKALAQKFLGEKKIHQVLSFPLENAKEESGVGFLAPEDENLQLGDIVISYPEVLKQAVKNKTFVDDEIAALVEHGMRHLLGENH